MLTIGRGVPRRARRVRSAAVAGLLIAAVGGCGSTQPARSARATESGANPPATTLSVASSASSTPVVPASPTPSSATPSSTTPARTRPASRPPVGTTPTSAVPASTAPAGVTTHAATAATTAAAPVDSAASPSSVRTFSVVSAKALSRLSTTFARASSQFLALADGAVPAEVGADAPVFASAAATFEHSLASLDLPTRSGTTRSRLETLLKRLSLELTEVADATQTGDLAKAKAQLSLATKNDAQIIALVASLHAAPA